MEYDIVIVFKTKYYYKKGTNILHREDGPAIERDNGDKFWYIDGDLHRTDGPAIELSTGHKEWWVNGKRLFKKEYDAKY